MERNQASFPRRLQRMFRTGSLAALCATAIVSAGASAAAASAPAQPALASATPELHLVNQTAFVKPGQMFDMSLGIRSAVPTSQLGIALSVYAPPDGLSSFDETLQGDTSSEPLVSDTPTVQLSSVSTDTSGDFKVQVGIASGDAPAAPAAFDLDLQCAPQSCSGVYPLRVELMDTANGSVVVDLVTHIVFVESAVASRLRVALVVPFGVAPSAPLGSGSPGPPDGSELSHLSERVRELSSATAPVTVLAQPQTVQALGEGDTEARAVADGLVAISDEAAMSVLPSTYVWIDPTSLVDAALFRDVAEQRQRGAQVMDAARVQTSGDATVVEGGMDQRTLQAIASDRGSEVVLPYDDIAPVTGRFAGPSVQTFGLPAGKGRTIEAAQTDPALQSELTDSQGAGGVLAAHQLLAALALGGLRGARCFMAPRDRPRGASQLVTSAGLLANSVGRARERSRARAGHPGIVLLTGGPRRRRRGPRFRKRLALREATRRRRT